MRSACRMTIEEDSGRFTQRFLSTESGRFRSNVEAGRRRRAMRPKSNAPRRSDTPTLAAYTLQRFKRYPCQRFVAGTAGPRVVASLSERAIQGQRRPIVRHGRTVKERIPHRETLYGFIKVRGNPTLFLTDALQSDGTDFEEIEYRCGSPSDMTSVVFSTAAHAMNNVVAVMREEYRDAAGVVCRVVIENVRKRTANWTLDTT